MHLFWFSKIIIVIINLKLAHNSWTQLYFRSLYFLWSHFHCEQNFVLEIVVKVLWFIEFLEKCILHYNNVSPSVCFIKLKVSPEKAKRSLLLVSGTTIKLVDFSILDSQFNYECGSISSFKMIERFLVKYSAISQPILLWASYISSNNPSTFWLLPNNNFNFSK